MNLKSVGGNFRELRKSKISYCSQSCAAIVNNPKSPKRRPKIRKCPACGAKFAGRKKYCSKRCVPHPPSVSKEQIISQIQSFYKDNRRIPLKREFYHYKAARGRFGTWNNTVKVAGFEPNPVKFAKKYIANDGHKCDSLAEKIIDDWLYARKIIHQINVPYHKNNMTADFKVNGVLIEFLGLHGELDSYDKLMVTKKKLWKEKKLKVIEIYPKDLFPKNKLDQLLKF